MTRRLAFLPALAVFAVVLHLKADGAKTSVNAGTATRNVCMTPKSLSIFP
jgi:hypothetical protein